MQVFSGSNREWALEDVGLSLADGEDLLHELRQLALLGYGLSRVRLRDEETEIWRGWRRLTKGSTKYAKPMTAAEMA